MGYCGGRQARHAGGFGGRLPFPPAAREVSEMKGVTWILVLLGLLGAVYLLGRDLQSIRGDRAGPAMVEPLQRAKDAATATESAGKALEEAVKKAVE